MSLHQRFLLLLSVLGAAVIANIAVTVWSVGLLDREQRRPVEQIGSVLLVLNDTKRMLWEQAGQLGLFTPPGEPQELDAIADGEIPQERVERFRDLGARALERIGELDAVEASLVRAGVNTASNLRGRIRSANQAFETYVATRDQAARQRALSELYTIHEFIERLEARLIEEARLASAHGARMQQRLTATLAASVVSVLIALATAAWLFRRWVLVRVDRLGVAAEHIGRGDLDHRIDSPGSDELGRVATQFNAMAATIGRMQAERIERERLAAIGDMGRRLAHNIRNPLGGIRSLAELSVLELDKDNPVRDHQQRIMKTVDQFNRWLNDLLSVSNPLTIEPAPADPRAWLEELVESHGPMAESQGVLLSAEAAEGPEEATFDRGHMEHVVSALVTNSIQASQRGGRVEVVLGRSRSSWTICVRDTGTGIAPKHLQSMFSPYFTTKQGGTGIGLAQAKRVVVQHGGRIWAENRSDAGLEGSGALLWVEIPLHPGRALATIGQVGEAERGQNPAPGR